MKLIFALLYAAAILMPSNKGQSPQKVADTVYHKLTLTRMKLVKDEAQEKARQILNSQHKNNMKDTVAYQAKTDA